MTITVEGLDLPEDDEERDELLNDITRLIRQKTREDGESEPGKITITDCYQYATLPPECPRCGGEPHRADPTIHPDKPREAQSKLDCRKCGYTASAIYKLVDIEKNKYLSEIRAERYISIVADGEVIPEYQSYER
ncbi:hypothetical protein [Saliphagus infecundisoli]|uniref:Transposase n=1 Tax=Saliphagus infecundisoli TaxID=1849069 RepID=A0ABD5QHB9_9EURY|nr:hypothetical protein [Saliphagus infecundisoli]